MRFLIYGLVACAALIAAAATFVFVALPTDFVRDELASDVLKRTGRTLSVAGPVSIQVYPQTAITLEDVRLSAPAGVKDKPTLAVQTMTVEAPLWPLLQHRLQITRFVLDHPVLLLRQDAGGSRSWDFRRAADEQPRLRGSQAAGTQTPAVIVVPEATAAVPAARHIAGLDDLPLRNVEIISGTVQLIDDSTGLNESLTDVSLKLGLETMDGPAKLAGAFTWSGQATAIEGSIGPVANLLSGDPASLDLAIWGALAKAKIKGTFAQLAAPPLSGKLHLDTGSLRGLLSWFKRAPPAGPGLGALSLATDFGLSAEGFAARDANLLLDGQTAKGSFSITGRKEKPRFQADLTMDRLDLNTYFAVPPAQPAPAPAQNAVSPAPAVPQPPAAEDVGWSTTPINLSLLRIVEGEVSLTLGALKWRSITTGKTAIKATFEGSVMKGRVSEAELYGGKGSGNVILDGSSDTTKMESTFALHGIDVQPFLTDTTGFNRIAGRGDVSFSFRGSGRSQLDIVKSLIGQGRMELADGAIVGVNLAAGVKALQNGQFAGWDSQPSAKTDFGSLTASCTVTNGVLDNRDLAVSAPALRLAGAGTANLPARTLDYAVQSSLVDSTEGQGAADAGTAAANGLTIPVHLHGPWAKPTATVDLASFAKNPQAALDTVKKAVGKFAASKQGKALGDLLGGLLDKAAKASDPPAAQEPAQ